MTEERLKCLWPASQTCTHPTQHTIYRTQPLQKLVCSVVLPSEHGPGGFPSTPNRKGLQGRLSNYQQASPYRSRNKMLTIHPMTLPSQWGPECFRSPSSLPGTCRPGRLPLIAFPAAMSIPEPTLGSWAMLCSSATTLRARHLGPNSVSTVSSHVKPQTKPDPLCVSFPHLRLYRPLCFVILLLTHLLLHTLTHSHTPARLQATGVRKVPVHPIPTSGLDRV